MENAAAIPFIGVLTVNRPDLLQRLIDSIDFPVENFAILFQGCIAAPPPRSNTNIKNLILHECDVNIGVSRGWNYLLRTAAETSAPYYVITGDDNYFAPSSLQRIYEHISNGDDEGSMFIDFRMRAHNHGKWGEDTETYSGFSTYIFVKGFDQRFGWFDENIYPAYFEDNDIYYRIQLSGTPSKTFMDVIIISGDDKETGSCTLNSSNAVDRAKISKCFDNNRDYVRAKWGWENEQFVFKHPYNIETNDIREQMQHPNFYSQPGILLGRTDALPAPRRVDK